MKFYQELQKGEDKATIPKWIGIQDIKKKLGETINTIDDINKKSDDAYKPLDNIKKEGFISNLQETYDIIKEKTLINPDPGTEATIQPDYIRNYGPYDSIPETSLSLIYKEYDIVINSGVSKIKQTQKMTDEINSSGDSIKGNLQSAQDSIDSLSTTFDGFAGQIINEWAIYQQYMNNYAYLGLFVLFGVLLGFAIIALTIMVLFVCKCNQCIRGILHFCWNVFALFSIISFLLGSILGIVGVIGTDGSDLFAYIFSDDNINSNTPILIGNDETIKTCITGDGELSKIFDLSSGGGKSLDELYNMSSTIKATKEELSKHTQSESVITKNTEFDKISKSFSLVKEANNALIKLNQYTNGRDPSTFQIRGFVYDTWVANQDYCQSIPDCYVVSVKGKDENILNKYDTIELKDEGDAKNIIGEYLERLIHFDSNNFELLSQMITKNDDPIQLNFKDDIKELDRTLTNVDGVIKPLIDVFGDVVGDNSIYSIINCKFVKNNLNIFLTEMNQGLGTNTTIFGAIILAISFCEAFSIIFLLIVTKRYRIKPGGDELKPNNLGDTEVVSKPQPDLFDVKSNSDDKKPEEIPVPILEKADI